MVTVNRKWYGSFWVSICQVRPGRWVVASLELVGVQCDPRERSWTFSSEEKAERAYKKVCQRLSGYYGI